MTAKKFDGLYYVQYLDLLALPDSVLKELPILDEPIKLLATKYPASAQTRSKLKREVRYQQYLWQGIHRTVNQRSCAIDVFASLTDSPLDSAKLFSQNISDVRVKIAAAVYGIEQLQDAISKKNRALSEELFG
ncbi:MAG: hypothetical protein Q9166_006482 [cf. Caloplaca sp. 2 TL-2023]